MTQGSSTHLTQPIQTPYPGLRPFQPHESAIFFGREEHVADMLTVLENHRFLAVVGPSGGGKSSLVLAGLIPALERGELLTAKSDEWRIVILRPGDSPYRNLAEAAQDQLWDSDEPHRFHDGDAGLTELVLRGSPFGFLDALRDAAIPEKANVLLLVDQFEELFRFRAHDAAVGEDAAKRRDDAAAFVQMLLETAKQTRRPVYVMLTMRSDFLGDCDVFDGLPQLINHSQYLTPRLNLTQLSEAIIQPMQQSPFSGDVAPELVQRILNDLGTGRDELPIVQHSLFRTWQNAKEHRPEETVRITVSDYDAVGGLKSALSRHADEALREFQDRGQERLVEKVFRGLCTRSTDGQQIRRPATIQQLADESGFAVDDVKTVVDAFRRPDRCFLVPPPTRELNSATKIDISHEAIIRQWQVLSGRWFRREDESMHRLLRVAQDEQMHSLQRGGLLTGVELDEVEQWWGEEQPTAAWVRRYLSTQPAPFSRGSDASSGNVDAHAKVSRFIALSRQEQTLHQQQVAEEARQRQETETQRRIAEAKAEAERRRGRVLRILLSVVAVIAFVAAGLGIAAVRASRQAEQSKERAEQSARAAQAAKDYAYEQRRDAMQSEQQARKAELEAETQREVAQSLGRAAVAAAELANRESSRAYSQVADVARKDGNSVKASHLFLRVANSLHGANAPIEEQRNVVLAAQFAAGNIIQTIPQFGSNVVVNGDGSRMLASPDERTTVLWDVANAKQMRVLQHDRRVVGSTFSPAESHILTWSDDGYARLWDVTGGAPLKTFNHESPMTGARFSLNESRMLTWGSDGAVLLWDVQTGGLLQTYDHDGPIYGSRFSPGESRVLAWSGDGEVKLWDVTKSEPLQVWKHEAGVNGAVFTRDESRVLAWSDDGAMMLWDVTQTEPHQVWKHEASVIGAVFTHDESRVLAWSGDGAVMLWGVTQTEPLQVWKHEAGVNGAVFTRDESRVLAWSGDGAVKLWDVTKAEPLQVWMHGGSVFAARFSADEFRVLTWSADNTARVFNVSESQPKQVFAHDSVIRGALFTKGDAEVLTWSADLSLKRWHAKHPRLLQTLPHEAPVLGAKLNEEAELLLTWCFDPLGASKASLWEISGDNLSRKGDIAKGAQLPLDVQGALLSRDGQRFLAWSFNTLASMEGEAVLWDLADSKVVRKFEHAQNKLAVRGASWSADESRVLTWGFDNTAKLWNVADKLPLQDFAHTDTGVNRAGKPIVATLNGAVLSADGKTIMTWSDDRTVRLWDAESGRERDRLQHESTVTGARFSPDESRVLTWTGGESAAQNMKQNSYTSRGGSGEARVWKLPTSGSPGSVAEQEVIVKHEEAVNGVWLNRLQTQVLTCSNDTTAAIWDIETGEQVQAFRGHTDSVLGAKFLRGDSLVLTWSHDRTAALWDVSRKLPLAVFPHDDSVDGALTNHDDTRLLTWSRDRSAKWWDISLHDEDLTPDERILEFEVRSATQLDAVGDIVPLKSQEWDDRRAELTRGAGTRFVPNAGR